MLCQDQTDRAKIYSTMAVLEMELPSRDSDIWEENLPDDSEEGVPLVMRGAWKQQLSPFRGGRGDRGSSDTQILRTNPTWTRRLKLLSILAVISLLYYSVGPAKVSSNSTTYKEPKGLVHFTCPAVEEMAAFTEDNEYTAFSKNILNSNNPKEYIENFREMEFDGWTKSYEDVKKGMYHWKSTRYLDLKNGDHIYESACGIGLNLVMTLEILNEVKGLENLVVYGNEYVPESVDVAHMLMTQGILPGKGQMGEICHGDSSSLHFVPSDAFDLAFTGYMTSMEDPLELKIGDRDQLAAAYHKICTGKTRSARETRLKMQRKQEDWFAKWVTEMVRITKPGGSIIFEQVTEPFCDSEELGAGVSKLFWINGVHRYRWPVDTSSLAFEADTIFQGRYHVSVRKWNHTESP